MEELLGPAGKELLSSGILGVIVFFLIWYIGKRENEWKDERNVHKEEIAAKDKRIEELSDARYQDVQRLIEIAQTFRGQSQAFLAALERKSS